MLPVVYESLHVEKSLIKYNSEVIVHACLVYIVISLEGDFLFYVLVVISW